MAFEILEVENWMYDTLYNDSTLQTLLAKLANSVKNYQQGIYTYIAPEKDPISGKSPLLPYIVIQKTGGSSDEKSLCGSTSFTYPTYRVMVWYAQSGSVSFNRIKDILDRVDTLLNNVSVTSTTPNFSIFKDSSDSIIQVEGDGRVYYAGILNYQIMTRS
jgi:hypothetical protein